MLPKISIIKKYFKLKLLVIKFLTQKSVGAHVYLPQEWSYATRKIDTFQIYCTEVRKYTRFRVELGQKYALYQTMLQIKVVEHYISYKKVSGCTCLSPQKWSYRARKFDMFQILYCSEMGKWIHLRAQRCQTYRLYQEIVQVKVIENRISYKKFAERTCLSPP